MKVCASGLQHRWPDAWVGVAAFVVLVGVGLGGAQLGAGVVSGVFVAGAVGAAVMTWRRNAGPVRGWIVAIGGLVATQSLLATLLAPDAESRLGLLDLGLLLTVALVGLVSVLTLLGVHPDDHVIDDGFAVGLGMGLVAAGWLLLQFPIAAPPSTLVQAVLGVLVSTQVAATALVLRQRALARPVSWLLATTVVVVATSMLAHAAGLAGTVWDSVAAVCCAAVGAAWLSTAGATLRRNVEEDRRRVTAFQCMVARASRDERERLHELRSTLAGLVTGSALVDSPDVPFETRQRLWCSVRRELDRMERLLEGQDRPATDIDLDEALGPILDLQRLKGRHVELHSNGDVVRARFDALSEVLNILMDNAVTHGGTDSSVVEVARRDEETVDITVTDFGRGIPQEQRAQIFEWGRRGSDSPGEGIGLHLAQRLMTEDGGSLRLAEDRGVGSSFVISLPAARRSPENDEMTVGVHHAWPRSG